MGPAWEDADGEEIVNETFTRLEKAFHGRTNWRLLLKVEAIIMATTMIVDDERRALFAAPEG